MLDRPEALAARWPAPATPVALQRRFGEVHGGYLEVTVTLAARAGEATVAAEPAEQADA